MSTFFDMDCGGETVTIERTDNGDIIFHGWDEETELAAIELGFEPSDCFSLWSAINDNILNDALIEQARDGNALLVKALILSGASAKAKTESFTGRTPLHAAAATGRVNVAKVLLEAGAYVDEKDRTDWTPLHEAAMWGNADVARILLEAGANVSAKSNDKWTPLHLAAYRGHSDVAKILLEAGANASAKDNNGMTPLRIASKWKQPGIAKIIKAWIAEHEK